MPQKTILEIPLLEQAQMRSSLRQARYGYLLGLHILLLCAAGHTPTEIASFLFCSRSSVYRTVAAYRRGKFASCRTDDEQTAETAPAPPLRSWQRSLLCLLKQTPSAFGWCRGRSLLRHAQFATGGAAPLYALARDHPAHPAPVGLYVEAGAPRGA